MSFQYQIEGLLLDFVLSQSKTSLIDAPVADVAVVELAVLTYTVLEEYMYCSKIGKT